MKNGITTNRSHNGVQLPRSIDVGDELDSEACLLALAEVPIKTRGNPMMQDGLTIDEWCRKCVDHPSQR